MLRLLILFLILSAKVVSSLGDEGSGSDITDDEDDINETTGYKTHTPEKSSGETDDTNLITIIIAAVCVFALAVLAVIAVILFKHHLQKREQGVYSVPVEQQQKHI